MQISVTTVVGVLVALRKESVDRNAGAYPADGSGPKSLSARRAWIEMQISVTTVVGVLVALRKESVDRNSGHIRSIREGAVALRKESVDRNFMPSQKLLKKCWSLSARRAWIEMSICVFWTALNRLVALRKESVDRNIINKSNFRRRSESLSARRAWIEIA